MDNLSYFFVILGFFAAVLFVEGLYMAWNAYRGPEARRIARRLQAMSAGAGGEQVSIIKTRLLSEMPLLDRVLQRIPRMRHLDRLLLQSGIKLNVAGILWLMVALALGGMLLCVFIGLPMFAVVAVGAVCAILPIIYVLRAKYQRLLTIETQLPDALDLMARAMRAGHAFPSALQMVADEMPQPVAGEFRIAFDEINFGIQQQDALKNLATRVPSTDLSYFVVAVLIQRETGGNLAELLNSISSLIRSRLKFLGTVRVLTAEGRLSAWILTLLPFGLAGVISLITPDFISVLWKDPMGLKLIGGALVLMMFGIFWMWRLIKVRV